VVAPKLSVVACLSLTDVNESAAALPLADPLPTAKMYIVVERRPGYLPRYIAMRGTSQLEGYHKHLIDLFVGSNYSALLAGALVTMFNFRCEPMLHNVARAWQSNPPPGTC
jgi:hypothetical protein